jgi:hypothetical protein
MRVSIGSISSARRHVRRVVAFALASVFAIGIAPAASAEQSTNTRVAESITGGAMLGAEAGTVVESLAGVHNPWVFAITDLVLAGGGSIGGYEVQQHSSNANVPIFILAAGVGLLIPGAILTYNATTQYLPDENGAGPPDPTNGTPANSPPLAPPSEGAPAPSAARGVSTFHLSLVAVNGDGVHMGLPVPEVRPMFSMTELQQYGLTQRTEVRMPLVKITF